MPAAGVADDGREHFNEPTDPMNSMVGWKITGIVATAVIILSIPLYQVVEKRRVGESRQPSIRESATFVGSGKCKDCHKPQYDKWQASHHRWAMETAGEDTVRGDFDDAVFERHGITSRFYRRAGKYFVYTQGPGGEMGDFEITHTFGWYPLQQYLVPFDGGRLQCLPIAWDVVEKRWYQLPPDEPLDAADWLYWTNAGQNWNGMCAECHSTNLQKNYDPDTGTYQTRWSEISIGCEACHGPGSEHVRWAELPEMGRPQVENYRLTVQTRGLTSRQQIELCAPCHSRRMSLGDNLHQNIEFMDYGIPQLLREGYYFADGQILEEVYVYGSFMQSKMYDRQVRCSDCHDVHSIDRLQEGNALCLQCHRAAIYDTADHHFHKKKGEPGQPIRSASGEVLFEVGSGTQCEQCHMPGRHYMGIDYRPDHSFRIPRPDLTLQIDVPNACDRCHVDKTTAWSVEAMGKWYGKKQRPHYGTVLAGGRRQDQKALDDLVRLAEDRLYPAIVRATALSYLAAYPGGKSAAALQRALQDEDALLRYTAVQNFAVSDPAMRLRNAGPLLYDPVKSVRIEAARNLVGVPRDIMPVDLSDKFEFVLAEYQAAMKYTADFAPSRHNLGNLAADRGQLETAVAHYRKAIEIDARFYPAKVNLAMLYNRLGKNAEAETLLRQVVAENPDLYEIRYSLGLLLAEGQKYAEAETHLAAAALGLPERARIHYNLGLLQQQLDRDEKAEISLQRAAAIEPGNLDFLYALADFYLKRGRLVPAERVAEQMITARPDQRIGYEIIEFIRNSRRGSAE